MGDRTILATGASGQLGNELKRLQLPSGWTLIPADRDHLDLTDTDAVAAYIAAGHKGLPWSAVINAAAFTAVDRAETEIVAAWAVNAQAPAALGQACARANIPIVQISTDYVFDGTKAESWDVHDATAPLGVYGASKLAGELAIKTSGARSAILRTAWVFSAHGSNFVKAMLRMGATNDVLRVVDDQIGSPTSAADLAHVATAIAIKYAEDQDMPSGIYHFSNAGVTSWAGFAEEIFRQAEKRGSSVARVKKIATADYPTPARRPANSALRHQAIEVAFGIVPRPWSDALADILDELIGVEK